MIGTCDWAWPDHGVLGEFDGKVKYGRLLKPGQDVGQVVFAEKQREDLIRAVTDFRMVRIIWSDYERPRSHRSTGSGQATSPGLRRLSRSRTLLHQGM